MASYFDLPKSNKQDRMIFMLENGLFHDAVVTSKEGDKLWTVHKHVLSSASSYFHELFMAAETGREDNTFVLEDVNRNTLEVLLYWMYTSTANICHSNVKEVFTAADCYILDALKEECREFMLNNLAVDNCIGVHRLSEVYDLQCLRRATLNFILENFESVYTHMWPNSEFLQLTKDELCIYLSSDKLIVKSEESVWDSITIWIGYDEEIRLKELPALLTTVRLSLISKEDIKDEILKHRYIQNDEQCKKIIEPYSQPEGQSVVAVAARERWPRSLALAFGGFSSFGPCAWVESYDYKLKCWRKIPSMEMVRNTTYAGVCTIDKHVYVIGGSNETKYYRKCMVYNMATMQWKALQKMHRKRCYVSVVELNGYIYAMGGFNGHARTNTAERYDPANNEWQMIPRMNFVRSDASATTLNGRIYIVGGFNGHSVINSAEFYDPQTERWTVIAPMAVARSGVSCVAHGKFLYAIGGFDSVNRLSDGEWYNPAWDSWSPLPWMSIRRSNFATVVLEKSILVAGGYNGFRTIANAESLDLDTMTWTSAAPLSSRKSGIGTCVVEGVENIEKIVYNNRNLQQQGSQDDENEEEMQLNIHQYLDNNPFAFLLDEDETDEEDDVSLEDDDHGDYNY